jgi:hypothetical protein
LANWADAEKLMAAALIAMDVRMIFFIVVVL